MSQPLPDRAVEPNSLWICNGIAFGLFAARLGLRKWRGRSFTPGDYWTMSATAFLVGRVVISHYILKYGTTNTLSATERAAENLQQADYDWLVLNSKLNLVSRFMLNSVLWSLKVVVLDLLRHMIRQNRYENTVLWTFYATFAITYVAATVNIFVECRPFELYWQIYPDPGECVKGNMWLVSYEIGNIITDAMLLALPFPILLQVRTKLTKRLQLMAIFSLGFFLIAVSLVRLIQGHTKARIQLARTMWASIETLVAAFVAMAPTLYTLLRNSTGSGSSGGVSGSNKNGNYTYGSRAPRLQTNGGPGRKTYGTTETWMELEEGPYGEAASTKGIIIDRPEADELAVEEARTETSRSDVGTPVGEARSIDNLPRPMTAKHIP